MKIDFYDLMDGYMEDEIGIETVEVVSAEKIKGVAMERMKRSRRIRPVRMALIAAVLILSLGTTVLASTDAFGELSRFLSGSLNKKFGGTGSEVVDTVSCGTELGVRLKNGDSVIITNWGACWALNEGQRVKLCAKIETQGIRGENDPGYGSSIGYIRCDGDGNALERQDIYHAQVFDTLTYTFEVPATGDYYFYFQHVSSDSYELDAFTVELVE